jgi:PAS domain S-box-containing protein
VTARLLELAQNMAHPITLAVYRVKPDRPLLELTAWLAQPDFAGEPPAASLPLSELGLLAGARVWAAGRRCTCGVQRWARSNAFQSLASATIGPPGAWIGLVTLSGGPASLHDLLPSLAELLAASFENVFQSQARISARDERLQQHLQHRQVQTTIEDHTREGLILLSPGLLIHKINNAALEMLGYAAEEVLDQPLERVLIASEPITPALAAALGGSPTHSLGQVLLFRRNGEGFPALVRIYPVIFSRQVIQIIIYLEDLQEREQIRLQTQQLENRALLGEVTAVFAHEIRNPINNISTSLQLMAMNLPQEDANQPAIARMLQDCDRLAELIRAVLAFSKPTDYEMEPLEMAPLLQRLMERLRPRMARAHVEADFKAEAECAEVLGNPRALEQVFSNLITNAINAMGEKGGRLGLRIEQAYEEERPYILVSVADTGPGIPHELQERIFQPFFTTETSGTGLGLAISKRILTAHKGDLRLKHSFPGGTIFVVRLPALV